MRLLILSLILILTGCASTTSITFDPDEANTPIDTNEFLLSAKQGTTSTWTKKFKKGFCGADFNFSVDKVYSQIEWEPIAKIIFSKENIESTFTLSFHFDKESKQVKVFIKHSEGDDGEFLDYDYDFDLQKTLVAMMYFDNDNIGFAFVPYSRLNDLLTTEGEVNIDVDFDAVYVGFKPDKMDFLAAGSDVAFKNMTFNQDC